MGDIVSYRPPGAREESTARLGMIIALASFAMMFACFFFAYGVVRARAAVWPPLDLPLLPIGLPGLNTAILAGSSLALQGSIIALRRGRLRLVAPAIALAALLGILFLALQTVVWMRLSAAGLHASSGAYASVFYGLTCIHAIHVGVGLLALVYLCARALRGAYNTPRHLPVRLWAMYWHFVGVIWALLYGLVYLI